MEWRRTIIILLSAMGITVGADLLAVPVASAKTPPVITVNPRPPSGWLRDGVFPLTFTADDDVGVGGVLVRLDHHDVAYWSKPCGGMQGPRCIGPSPPLVWVLEPAKLADGEHEVNVSAVDDDWSSQLNFTIRVDHTSPAAVSGLGLVGLDDWRSENRFEINWGNPRDVGPTPLVGVDYRLCPATSRPDDITGCVYGQRAGAAVTDITDLAVPASGAWRLRLAVRDAAGNSDLVTGASLAYLRYDGERPSLSIQPPDGDQPSRIHVSASDAHSGLARVELEARREGETTWRSVPVAGAVGSYTAEIDDLSFPAGTYELRARAIDRVGNERTVSTWSDGASARLQLPLRQGSLITAGAPKANRKLDSVPNLRFGASAGLSGRLTDSFGAARAKAPVEVWERVNIPGAEWRRLTTLSTSDAGRFALKAPAGPARTLRFQYPGSSTTRPAAADVTLRVGAGVSLQCRPCRLRNGQAVLLHGRLRGGAVPPDGKLLTLQARTSRGWRTFATTRARGTRATWRYRYRFTDTTSTVSYAFRVVVPAESGYPYVRGVSKTARVRVRAGG
jgi:hypothetical protein